MDGVRVQGQHLTAPSVTHGDKGDAGALIAMVADVR
jgi:hypothetical protein